MRTMQAARSVRFVGIGIVVLVLLGSAGGVAAQGMDVPGAGTPVQKRSIRVQGQATMSVEPDIAYLALGVETQSDTAAKAQEILAERASNVLASLSQAGIDRSRIKTSSYRVSPVYSTKQDIQNVVIGYRAETRINVEVSDLPSVAGLVDAAMSAGANAVRSLSFDRKDMQSFKTKLIEAACTDAKMKADAAAAALGVRIGAPVSVNIRDSFSAFDAGDDGILLAAERSPVFYSPGELDIDASVTIEFDLVTE